jgi:glycosyltransferase involved in cell wall biosynthesis
MPHDNTSGNAISGNPASGNPEISVIIPAYKAADHIASALGSVFGQSFTDFEVIVINDGSPDTDQMESAIAPYRDRIVYLKQPNRGPSAARNLGIRHARAEFLAFLDSDDTWLPEYLFEQIHLLRGDPSLDMVYSDGLFFGNTASSGKTFMELCPSNGPVTFDSLLTEQTQVITSGSVVRRQAVIRAGLFDEDFRCAEDHDLWLRLAYLGCKIAYQRKVLVHHLVRSDSQGSPPGSLIAGEIQVLEKLDRQLQLNPHTRSLLAQKLQRAQFFLGWMQGRYCLLYGDPQKAYELFHQANVIRPTLKLSALLLSLRVAPRLTASIAKRWNRD